MLPVGLVTGEPVAGTMITSTVMVTLGVGDSMHDDFSLPQAGAFAKETDHPRGERLPIFQKVGSSH